MCACVCMCARMDGGVGVGKRFVIILVANRPFGCCAFVHLHNNFKITKRKTLFANSRVCFFSILVVDSAISQHS